MCEYVNSKQAQFTRSLISCGMLEVHHLPDQSPAQTVFAIANALYHKANGRPSAFIAFSDVVDRKDSRGVHLAAAIKQLNMGALLETPKAIYPRTGNLIQVWVWCIDHDSFRKWFTEEFANRLAAE
jgi:hypothetical protein